MPKGDGNRGKGKSIAFLRAHIDFYGAECLLWPFSTDDDGYGHFSLNGEHLKAHRWMCEEVRGPAPTPSHYAAHGCGNGHLGCVHPRHLDWKTHAENTEDYIRDGRTRRGKGRRLRKLTHEQVHTLLNPPIGITILQISQEFGISYRHAKKIRQGTSWRDGMPHKTGTSAIHNGLISSGKG